VKKPLVTPPAVRLVMTREAAKVLDCSMRQVRALAATGRIKSWELGPRSFAYSIDELLAYKAEKTAGRKKGTVRGALPQGFKPHVTPAKRK